MTKACSKHVCPSESHVPWALIWGWIVMFPSGAAPWWGGVLWAAGCALGLFSGALAASGVGSGPFCVGGGFGLQDASAKPLGITIASCSRWFLSLPFSLGNTQNPFPATPGKMQTGMAAQGRNGMERRVDMQMRHTGMQGLRWSIVASDSFFKCCGAWLLQHSPSEVAENPVFSTNSPQHHHILDLTQTTRQRPRVVSTYLTTQRHQWARIASKGSKAKVVVKVETPTRQQCKQGRQG